jgi:4-amino-4-deoxy-L-arabinose transferase-like glycosyltransferase
MDRQRFLLPMLALLTVWRLALLPTIELSPDEALGLFYARHPDWWHLEMGPLTPWMIKISTTLFGSSPIGLRWMAPLLGLAITLMIWRLCRGVFDTASATWTVLLVQVLPAFNLISTTMTSSTVGLTTGLLFMLCFRQAMHRASAWHAYWWLSALALCLSILADWRLALLYGSAVLTMAVPPRRRHHLRAPGHFLLILATLTGLAVMLLWNLRHDWPTWESGELEPVWSIVPSVLRWTLLASPFVLTLLVWVARMCWRQRDKMPLDVWLFFSVIIPMGILDFGWGPRERWPHMGFPIWLVLGLGVLSYVSISAWQMHVRAKIMIRTLAVLMTALQTMVLLRTDLLRSLGLRWGLHSDLSEFAWHRFFKYDPSGVMQGWEQAGDVLDQVLRGIPQETDQRWFVIADSWQLATCLDAYLPSDAPLLQPGQDYPRIHTLQTAERNHPMALYPRYDWLAGQGQRFRTGRALFVTDSNRPKPPPAITQAFQHCEAVSIIRIMHAGYEVRTLQIFACHDYKPPDL